MYTEAFTKFKKIITFENIALIVTCNHACNRRCPLGIQKKVFHWHPFNPIIKVESLKMNLTIVHYKIIIL